MDTPTPSSSSPGEPAAVVASTAPELAPVPREVSGRVVSVVRRDPRVGLWVMLSGVVTGVALFLGVQRVLEWSADRWLVTSGTEVEAKIIEAAGVPQEGRRQPWSELMRLRYRLPDGGGDQEVTGRFREMPGGQNMVIVGQTVKIRVDPSRPGRWTDRSEPPSVVPALVSVYLLAPVALAMGLWALVMAGRLRRVWREGVLLPAAVLSVQSSAIAPGFAVVTAAPSGSREGVRVYVPRKRGGGNLQRGDVVWVLRREGGGPAMAAAAFLQV